MTVLITVLPRALRFIFCDLHIKLWRLKDCVPLILPLAVNENRFLTALFDFNLGIFSSRLLKLKKASILRQPVRQPSPLQLNGISYTPDKMICQENNFSFIFMLTFLLFPFKRVKRGEK